MYLLGGFDFEGMLFADNVGKWRNLKCILIRLFPQKILEIFTYSTKNNVIVAKPLLGSLGKE